MSDTLTKARKPSNLPAMAGKLSLDFNDDFGLDRSYHLTDEYLDTLALYRSQLNENHCCAYCGFRDGIFLEVDHINNDHTNYDPDNLQLICTLCHRIRHLGWVGVANLGEIIYLPRVEDDNELSSRFWLEPVNLLQRFYLMSSDLSPDSQQRLNDLPLSKNIQLLQTALKAQNLGNRYQDAKNERIEYENQMQRIKDASAKERPQVVKEVEAEREKKRQENVAKNDSASKFFGDLHLLDLLDQLVKTDTKQQFLDEQNKGTYGRMAIWFNTSVFAPFEPEPAYTLEDRLDYYRSMGLFTVDGITNATAIIRKF